MGGVININKYVFRGHAAKGHGLTQEGRGV
jgi:hypothetical protein